MKAVASKAPAAKLNNCCVWRANTVRVSHAATHTLPTPAINVARTIQISFISYQLLDKGKTRRIVTGKLAYARNQPVRSGV